MIPSEFTKALGNLGAAFGGVPAGAEEGEGVPKQVEPPSGG